MEKFAMGSSLRSLNNIYSTSNQLVKSAVHGNELMEILWKNGPMHMVTQSEMNPKHAQTAAELGRTQIPNFVCSTIPQNLVQETDNFPGYSLGDAFEKDFSSELLSDFPSETSHESNTNDTNVQFTDTSEIGNAFIMSPLDDFGNGKHKDFPDFSKPIRKCESSSLTTLVTSVCGENQSFVSEELKKCGKIISPLEKLQNNSLAATLTSSSVISECILGPKSTSNSVLKRKERDGEELDSYREEAGYESSEPDKICRRHGRKARAAEVHNLSERRRRDRINEKMKALQELLPHCNKTDKASMLDEAIEYLKSLQLQLQLLWMGSGMEPMMFPSMQQYMSRVSIGTSRPSSLPSFNNTIQSSRTPQVNNITPASSYNSPIQMQNVQLPAGSYAPYPQFPHMQMPNKGTNLHTYASQHMQNQTIVFAGNINLPAAAVSMQNIRNGG